MALDLKLYSTVCEVLSRSTLERCCSEKQKGKYYYSTVVCQCTFVDGRFTNINKYKKNYIQYSCTPDTVYNAIEWTCVTYICMTVKCIRILNRTQ